ncbi:hypothetical protein [Amnibacterium kyonggiense]|nr:hypothetical protein [Amnibacterium kyonggiense]
MVAAGQGLALSRTIAVNCILQAGSDSDPLGGEIHAFGGAAAFVEQQFDGLDVRRLADVSGAKVYLVTDRSAGASALWVLDHGNALELSAAIDRAETMRPAVAPILSVLDRRVR